MIQGSFRRLMMRSGGSQLSDAAAFLANYGPFGMVMDFTDASIAINDETDVLDYSSQGTVHPTTGALLGPGSKLVYSAPSAKLTEQADGYLGFQAHNLYLNSATPANQSITVISGATYAITITGSVSVTASGAATGTWTAGTTEFTAATGTLTLGSTSGSGTVHVRRTPSVSTYVATTGAVVYDLPYVYSGGVRTGIQVELAATNLALRSNDFTNASWTKSNLTAAMTATGPDGVANSASTLTATAGNATAMQAITSGSASRLTSVYIKRRTGSGNIDLTQDNGSTWTTQTVTSAWTRVSIVAVTSTNPTVGIRIVTSGDEVDVWCFQHETGTVVTSPIPTYTAAVTRAADTLYILTNLFPSSILTFSVYCNYVLPSPSFNFPCAFTVYQGSSPTGNRAQIYHATSGANYSSAFRVNSSLGASIGGLAVGVAIAPLTSAKSMFAVQSGSNAACTNGGTVATDAAAVVFADLDRLAPSQSEAARINGLIKSIAYFPERKADATLQTMTTA